MEVKFKFQDKFYDIIDHNKCPSSETSAENCVLMKSNFHQILPTYGAHDCQCLAAHSEEEQGKSSIDCEKYKEESTSK